MDDRATEIEKALSSIGERNRRVEADKAWETSSTRYAVIAAVTYIVAALLLWVLRVPDFYFAALVPTFGFLISAQSLPFLKKRWIKNHLKEK